MQENDSKKLNPKKINLIPNSEVREIIRATTEAIEKSGNKPKTADTILRLARAYLTLAGAYKDLKHELSALENTHGSRKELLKDLIGRLENQVQDSAEAVVEYEDEIQQLRKQNAGLLRRAQDMERQNKSLVKKLEIERQVKAVTGTEFKAVPQDNYDGQEDVKRHYKALHDDHVEDLKDEAKGNTRKPKGDRFSHSSQRWRPARNNVREDARKAAKMRERVIAAGDDTTEDILALLGE